MNAEERTLKAIQVTRRRLNQVLVDPEVLVMMTAWDIKPGELENTITEILRYLEKTAPDKLGEAEG